jgi:hypothetical protein
MRAQSMRMEGGTGSHSVSVARGCSCVEEVMYCVVSV